MTSPIHPVRVLAADPVQYTLTQAPVLSALPAEPNPLGPVPAGTSTSGALALNHPLSTNSVTALTVTETRPLPVAAHTLRKLRRNGRVASQCTREAIGGSPGSTLNPPPPSPLLFPSQR